MLMVLVLVASTALAGREATVNHAAALGSSSVRPFLLLAVSSAIDQHKAWMASPLETAVVALRK